MGATCFSEAVGTLTNSTAGTGFSNSIALMAEAVLNVVDLEKRYGQTTALAGVSFQAQAGELFGLLGPNGAGKTTLLSIVSCLIEATSGEAWILGRKASTRDRELRRLIGIVPQELAIYGELNARENLNFFGSLYGISGQQLRSRVDEVLAAIGLTDRADDRVGQFLRRHEAAAQPGSRDRSPAEAAVARRADHGRRPPVAQPHFRGSSPAGRPGRVRRLHEPLHRRSASPLLARSASSIMAA